MDIFKAAIILLKELTITRPPGGYTKNYQYKT